MLINSNSLSVGSVITTDVCIMGAGVAGITIANEMMHKVGHVVLLESGGEKYDEKAQSSAKANNVPSPYPDPHQTRQRMLGGTSNHWANNTSPLSPIDFEKREGIDNSGWPISYQDIEPYYKRASVYCGTGEEGYDTKYWHEKFSINPLIKPGQSQVLELGIAKAAVPPTRFFEAHGAALKDSTNVAVYSMANVIDMVFSRETEKVESIVFMGGNGLKHTVHANEFIMAFGGIENARMMLYFNHKYDNKLGNTYDNVGRHFMDHPTIRGAQIYTAVPEIFTLFEGEMTSDYKRFILNFMQLSESALLDNELTNIRLPVSKSTKYDMSSGISSFHTLKERISGKSMSGTVGQHVTNVLMDIDMVTEAVSRKTFDFEIFNSASDFAGFEVPLMMEQTPHRDNRIVLSKETDAFGIPKVNIQWELKEADKDRLWKGLDVVGRELGALNIGRLRSLKERSSRLFNDQIGFGHHHMGTTRMSNIESEGVVDAEQKVYGTKNLSLAGCSVFVTGGHVPPTLTITATSIRLSEIIVKRMS
jgi:choline dehydrogenase-like flavoprotein